MIVDPNVNYFVGKLPHLLVTQAYSRSYRRNVCGVIALYLRARSCSPYCRFSAASHWRRSYPELSKRHLICHLELAHQLRLDLVEQQLVSTQQEEVVHVQEHRNACAHTGPDMSKQNPAWSRHWPIIPIQFNEIFYFQHQGSPSYHGQSFLLNIKILSAYMVVACGTTIH